jgi:hypothetical protein
MPLYNREIFGPDTTMMRNFISLIVVRERIAGG